MIDYIDGTTTSEDINKPKWAWEETRSFNFHVCVDTNKTIWPFTKAYLAVSGDWRRRDGDTEWLSAKAFTFRKLAGTLL